MQVYNDVLQSSQSMSSFADGQCKREVAVAAAVAA